MVASPQPRRARKSCYICVLPLPSFNFQAKIPARSGPPSFDFQLSTLDLRIILSPSLAALCSKSVEQLLSHQSLPHSFLKMPGCTFLFVQKSPSIPAVSRITNLKTEDHHERTIHPPLLHPLVEERTIRQLRHHQ